MKQIKKTNGWKARKTPQQNEQIETNRIIDRSFKHKTAFYSKHPRHEWLAETIEFQQ